MSDQPSVEVGASDRLKSVEPIINLANCKLISQGAEARVWETIFLGRPTVVKQRFTKMYRHPVLDAKLTVTRLKGEVRSLMRARKLGVLTPVLYYVEHEANCIYMEQVQGMSIKQQLSDSSLSEEDIKGLMFKVGAVVASMHDGGLIHGDLTTSNLMVRTSDKAVVVIDFGLSMNSTLPEEKGVDLYVMERAMGSAHSEHKGLFDQVLDSYKKHSKQWSATCNRFAEVRMRGRKRTMLG